MQGNVKRSVLGCGKCVRVEEDRGCGEVWGEVKERCEESGKMWGRREKVCWGVGGNGGKFVGGWGEVGG